MTWGVVDDTTGESTGDYPDRWRAEEAAQYIADLCGQSVLVKDNDTGTVLTVYPED